MIMRHPEVNANVDQFMLTNVVPLIKSEFGFLRAAVRTVGITPHINDDLNPGFHRLARQLLRLSIGLFRGSNRRCALSV
jgi:hypothetical protein